jgi:hypothetical protein
MSIWTRVRSLWESEKALDSAADSLLFSFKRMSSQYPERDPNAWLAWAIANRPGWGHHEKQELLLMAAPYAITPAEQATALLGLDTVVEEHPELSRLASEKHRELYLPVEFAIKNGSFLKRWRESNPWTNENYPSVEQELKHGLLAGQNSRPVQKVRITCPNCRVELRIPGVTGGKKIRCPKCSSLFVVEP